MDPAQCAGTDLSTPHGRLRADIGAVRKAFDDPKFLGKFKMCDWVRERSREKDWCGTSACLGGWMNLLGISGWNGRVFSGEDHYGMTQGEANELFFKWPILCNGGRWLLKDKLTQAERIADAIEERNMR